MADIRIRELEEQDVPRLAQLLAELSEVAGPQREFAVADLSDVYALMRQHEDVYLNVVAEAEGDVSGFLSLVFYRSFFHRVGTALINELVVRSDMRRRGIGNSLLEYAVAEARRRGMDEIEVGTETRNAAAARLYRAAGFDEEYLLLGMEFESDH